jgi:hypothetical protein
MSFMNARDAALLLGGTCGTSVALLSIPAQYRSKTSTILFTGLGTLIGGVVGLYVGDKVYPASSATAAPAGTGALPRRSQLNPQLMPGPRR